MSKIAYGLRADYAEDGPTPFYGGLIRTSSTSELNVAQALEDGGGVIVVDETAHELVDALDHFPALKRVAVPAGPSPEVLDAYRGRKVGELRDELKALGLPTSGNRETLVGRLASAAAAGLGVDDATDAAVEEHETVEAIQPADTNAAPAGSDDATDGNPAAGTHDSPEL